MGVLVHPQSELIREPRLLVPGRKPIGPVKINQSHALSDKLKNCYGFAGQYAGFGIDIASNKPTGVYAAFGTITEKTSELGKCIESPNGSAIGLVPNESWAGPCTLLLHAKWYDEDSNWPGYFAKTDSGTNHQIGFYGYGTTTNIYAGAYGSDVSYVDGVQRSDLINSIAEVCIVTVSSATNPRITIYKNAKVGVADISGSQATGTGEFCIGCGNVKSSAFDVGVDLYSVVRWGTVLPVAAIASLLADPYQFLVPA
jgi:hypothetical protein